MSENNAEFEYNRDLYLSDAQRQKMQEKYPLIWFALGQPNSEFSNVDASAKREKVNFRNYGYAAVALATVALILASIEPTLIAPRVEHKEIPEVVATIIATAASLAGLLGVLIGWAGMGISTRKRAWLQNRLLAERMRQWQWQHFVGSLAELASMARDEEKKKKYVAERARAFRNFHAEYERQIGARLNEILGEGEIMLEKIWLDPRWPEQSAQAAASAAIGNDVQLRDEIFRAYRDERFGGQIDYAVYQLGPGPFATHPVAQLGLLHTLGRLMVAFIVGLHVAVVVGVFLNIEQLKSPGVYVLTLWLALVALALRVIEDGFRPTEQIARLKGYLGAIAKAREKFDSAKDVPDRVVAMQAMEEAAVLELVEFVQAADKARFVM